MIVIQVTEANWASANQLAKECMAKLPPGPSYTGLSGTHERFFVGYVGEFAIRQWLEGERIRHTHRTNTDGRGHAAEFVIHEGGDWELEVKNAGKPFHEFVMYPANQHNHWDVLMGTRMSGFDRKVELHGWLGVHDRGKLELVQMAIPTLRHLLSTLRDPEKLLEHFRRLRERHGDDSQDGPVEE